MLKYLSNWYNHNGAYSLTLSSESAVMKDVGLESRISGLAGPGFSINLLYDKIRLLGFFTWSPGFQYMDWLQRV